SSGFEKPDFSGRCLLARLIYHRVDVVGNKQSDYLFNLNNSPSKTISVSKTRYQPKNKSVETGFLHQRPPPSGRINQKSYPPLPPAGPTQQR
ncbi:MAG: hypothetical protein KDJ65_28920, partial [Anaerolineae bacterium]|nr:hypothetical protein [Anaerolineae bacterium]